MGDHSANRTATGAAASGQGKAGTVTRTSSPRVAAFVYETTVGRETQRALNASNAVGVHSSNFRPRGFPSTAGHPKRSNLRATG